MSVTHNRYIMDLQERIADGKRRVEAAKASMEKGFEFPNLFKGLEEFSKNVKTVGYIAVAVVGGIVVIKVIGLVD